MQANDRINRAAAGWCQLEKPGWPAAPVECPVMLTLAEILDDAASLTDAEFNSRMAEFYAQEYPLGSPLAEYPLDVRKMIDHIYAKSVLDGVTTLRDAADKADEWVSHITSANSAFNHSCDNAPDSTQPFTMG